MTQSRRARDDQEPFFLRIFVVIRADSLAGRELIDAEPRAGRAEQRADSRAVPSEAVRQLWTRLAGDRGEVGSPNGIGTHWDLLS
jgi:hypothetical protein